VDDGEDFIDWCRVLFWDAGFPVGGKNGVEADEIYFACHAPRLNCPGLGHSSTYHGANRRVAEPPINRCLAAAAIASKSLTLDFDTPGFAFGKLARIGFESFCHTFRQLLF
jgi:hypothetical protein